MLFYCDRTIWLCFFNIFYYPLIGKRWTGLKLAKNTELHLTNGLNYVIMNPNYKNKE